MAKKRLIFTLLYDSGSIDELIVLDVSRSPRNRDKFSEVLKILTNDCFAPIAAGGGINSVADATKLLRSGADKIVVNSALHSNKRLISELAREFGRQCIIASVDCKQLDGNFYIATNNGSNLTDLTLTNFLEQCSDLAIGEICINSIDRDGTGNGFQIELLNCLPELFEIPVIISGGVGNYSHLAEGLNDARVDAVATANLLNFMGDGLGSARAQLVNLGIDLPNFNLITNAI